MTRDTNSQCCILRVCVRNCKNRKTCIHSVLISTKSTTIRSVYSNTGATKMGRPLFCFNLAAAFTFNWTRHSPVRPFFHYAFNRINDLACAWKTSKYFKNASVSAGTSACETNVLGSISAICGVGRTIGDRGRAMVGDPGSVSRDRARCRVPVPRPGEVERLRWTTASSCFRSCLTTGVGRERLRSALRS